MDLQKITIVILRVNGWIMLFYALHGATYPIQRLMSVMQRGDTEFINLFGFFAPDIIRFAMYVIATFLLIKYSRLLAWLLCRDLLANRDPSVSKEATLPE